MIRHHEFKGSTALFSCEYDTKGHKLQINFTDGDVRRYVGVGESEYDGLIRAESAGRYFNENIRNSYREG